MKNFRPSIDRLERREAPSSYFGVITISNGTVAPPTVYVRPFPPLQLSLEPLRLSYTTTK